MPGPDGIPAAAFKELGEVAVDVLHAVTMALCSQDFKHILSEAYHDRCKDGLHDFNLSLLCCLPKKPFGTDPDSGEFYRGEDTRPLALVNTDNRIIANAARITWEPILGTYISRAQQGFLKGRHMLHNVIEIDYDAMTVSMKCERGMLVLFDFKAAFPSVAHDFLKTSLAAVGLPEHALHFIEALYDNNYCNIAFQGTTYEGFDMQSGVRQGCPISPLLFAASVDVLLRILQKRISDGTFKAFADDIGAVFQNWDTDSSTAAAIFKEFAEMSGLELNIQKTVCIPLWDENIEDVQRTFRTAGGLWQNVCVAAEGTYLGFKVGPGSPNKSWEKPLKKFEQRCAVWGGMGTGAMFSTLAYNTFICSTLSFVAQLVDLNEQVLVAEQKGINKMLPGPGNWLKSRDPFYLKESFGQQCSFRSMQVSSVAAKMRVKYLHDSQRRREGPQTSMLRISTMAANIKHIVSRNWYPQRAYKWKHWFEASFAIVLQDNADSIQANHGIREEDVLLNIAGHPPPWDPAIRIKQRKAYQSTISKQLLAATRPDPVERIRENISRWAECKGRFVGWGIPGYLGQVAPRIHRNLERLRLLVPPRVCASAFRTIFNGWTTHRRFQKRHLPTNVCVLGCSRTAEDNIEHYCRCPAILQVLRTKLRLAVAREKALSFWMLDCPNDEEVLICSAVSSYAGYIACNHYRHADTAPSIEQAIDALGQYIIQSASGHPKLMSFLDSRWATPMRSLN